MTQRDSRNVEKDRRLDRDEDQRSNAGERRPACPVCGGSLIERRGKLICARCHTICETCCEGGRG